MSRKTIAPLRHAHARVLRKAPRDGQSQLPFRAFQPLPPSSKVTSRAPDEVEPVVQSLSRGDCTPRHSSMGRGEPVAHRCFFQLCAQPSLGSHSSALVHCRCPRRILSAPLESPHPPEFPSDVRNILSAAPVIPTTGAHRRNLARVSFDPKVFCNDFITALSDPEAGEWLLNMHAPDALLPAAAGLQRSDQTNPQSFAASHRDLNTRADEALPHFSQPRLWSSTRPDGTDTRMSTAICTASPTIPGCEFPSVSRAVPSSMPATCASSGVLR